MRATDWGEVNVREAFGSVRPPASSVSLKAGRGSDVSLVDARGLAGQELRLATDLRPNLFIAEIYEIARGVELTPGEETPVPVRVPDLRRNANVSEIEATLTARASTTPAPAESTSVEVTTGSGAATTTQGFGVSVIPPELPRNVQMRLDRGDVFWTHSGALTEGTHLITGFADQVNAYLDELKAEGGETILRFLVKSETPGNVTIDVMRVVYTLLQTETWPNPLDGSLRIDRNLQLEFGARSRIELAPLQGPPTPHTGLDRVMLNVSGEVGPERLLGDVPAAEAGHSAKVNGDYAVGQGVRLSSDPGAGLGFEPGDTVRVAGLTGAHRAQGECELYVELQSDAAGRPTSGPPIASRTLTLAPIEGEAAAWAFVGFDEPAEMEVDRDYWVIFRGIRGTATLSLTTSDGQYLTDVRVNRGGQLWKTLGGPVWASAGAQLATLMRLVYLPEPDNESAAVELGLEGGIVPLLADPVATVQRLTFDAPAQARPAALVVSSRARGMLTLANVVQEFGVDQVVGP